MKTKIAVVGCGRWGKHLVRNFYELGGLSYVCDADESKLKSVEQDYLGVQVCTKYEELLGTDVSAIVIATTAENHAWMAEAALRSGKDVFVEKPLALRYRDGENLVNLAESLDRILMVGHLLEYHPAILRLKRLIDDGELGKVFYVYSNRLNLGRIRREENILWSFAPHDIAVILRLIGDLPLEVAATGGAYLQPNIADVTVTNLHFDNGVRAHIFVSWLHPYKEHRLVVVGSKKMASFNDLADGDKLLIYDQGIEWVNGEPVPPTNPGTRVEFDMKEPLRAECEHFIECLNSRKRPRTDGRSALDVLNVLQACQRSLQTNGSLVHVASQTLEIVHI